MKAQQLLALGLFACAACSVALAGDGERADAGLGLLTSCQPGGYFFLPSPTAAAAAGRTRGQGKGSEGSFSLLRPACMRPLALSHACQRSRVWSSQTWLGCRMAATHINKHIMPCVVPNFHHVSVFFVCVCLSYSQLTAAPLHHHPTAPQPTTTRPHPRHLRMAPHHPMERSPTTRSLRTTTMRPTAHPPATATPLTSLPASTAHRVSELHRGGMLVWRLLLLHRLSMCVCCIPYSRASKAGTTNPVYVHHHLLRCISCGYTARMPPPCCLSPTSRMRVKTLQTLINTPLLSVLCTPHIHTTTTDLTHRQGSQVDSLLQHHRRQVVPARAPTQGVWQLRWW